MRHLNSVRQLGRTHAHRKALYRNMATSLVLHERIVTTREKAKEIRRVTEKLITRAKKNLLIEGIDAAGKLHNKREAMKVITTRDALTKLFEEIAPRFKDRKGGYTRIILMGKRRPGDSADMAIIELVVKGDKSAKKATPEKKEPKEKKK